MFVDRKPFLYLWRPIYRNIIQGIGGPLLERCKTYFLLETSAQLGRIAEALDRVEGDGPAIHQRLAFLEGRIDEVRAGTGKLLALEQQNHFLLARLAALEVEHTSQSRDLSQLLARLHHQDFDRTGPLPSSSQGQGVRINGHRAP